jgi:ribosomal protein L14
VCAGDRIVVVVQKQRSAGSEATTAAALASKVRRGDIRHAVVVRVKKELQRPDGSLVRFGDNACVLVNKSGDPIGTRMNGWSSRVSALTYTSRPLTFHRSRRTGTTEQEVVEDLVFGTGPRVISLVSTVGKAFCVWQDQFTPMYQ